MSIHTNLLKVIFKQKFIFFLPATGKDKMLRIFLNEEDQKLQRHHQSLKQTGVGGIGRWSRGMRQMLFIYIEWLSLSLKHFLIPQSGVREAQKFGISY